MYREKGPLSPAGAAIARVRSERDTFLFLKGMSLRKLPDLRGLDWLETLEVSENELEQLPPEIGDLKNLDAIYANNNRLRSLPPAIGNLSRLRFLTLNNNMLKQLPNEISQLTTLEQLRISNNHLQFLPEDLGNLTGLTTLDVSSNELTRLPRSISRILSIQNGTMGVSLEHNPFEDPLGPLRAAGVDSVLAYLRTLSSAEGRYEAKLILVGEGEVGKTSLVAALREEGFVEGRPTTHGIEIGQLLLPHPQLPLNIQLNTWDFGGQEVYRISHQFFFSGRSIYLLVWNPRQGQEANEVEGWIRRIRLRVGPEARIIVAATHADLRRPELDFVRLKSNYGEVLIDSHSVDSKSRKGFEKLKTSLATAAAALPQMGELLSPNWIQAWDSLLSSTTVPYMAYSEFKSTCRGFHMADDEVDALSRLLHDLGHIIHYADDEGLRDLVIIKPEWITRAIGLVLEDAQTRVNGGILDHGRLKEIWQPSARPYPTEQHPYFLRLMEKFDVSFRLPDSDSSLVAQLVPYEEPKGQFAAQSSSDTAERVLQLTCVLSDEAPGLIAWLTVRNHRFSVGRHWRRGVHLVHVPYASRAVFALQDDRKLSLHVQAPSPDYFFSILRDGLEDMISRRWPGLAYSFFVPCPTKGCQGEFPMKTLQRHRERSKTVIECPDCFTNSDIQKLVTGFDTPGAPLHQILEGIRSTTDELRSGLQRVEALSADAAQQTRLVLKAISAEVDDCPRLFTVAYRGKGLAKARFWEEPIELTLWCEHPGAEHPLQDGVLTIRQNKQWFREVAPYASLLVKTLRLVLPLAGDFGTAFFGERDSEVLSKHLESMKAFAEMSAELEADEEVLGAAHPAGGISQAEGAGLRAFRAILFAQDASQYWGGLQRRLTASGDFAWICREHYALYDPGLPRLPGGS